MVVDEDEEVEKAVLRSLEWSGNVAVDESPYVRGCVRLAGGCGTRVAFAVLQCSQSMACPLEIFEGMSWESVPSFLMAS